MAAADVRRRRSRGFSSYKRRCEHCERRQVETAKGSKTQYFHRVVVAHLIGTDLPVALDVEPVARGEGEVAAARRLVARVVANHGRMLDGVCADALYFEAPFFNDCIALGLKVLAVLKGERRTLLQDAQGLFASSEPSRATDRERDLELWDVEDFASAEGIEVPLRVVRCRETPIPKKPRKGPAPPRADADGSSPKATAAPSEASPATVPRPSDWWWVTTIPSKVVPARQIARMGHARWDIENRAFNALATHWGLDHAFRHRATAILNFVLTLLFAFVALNAFHRRNVKDPRLRATSLIALAAELATGLPASGPRDARRDAPSPDLPSP